MFMEFEEYVYDINVYDLYGKCLGPPDDPTSLLKLQSDKPFSETDGSDKPKRKGITAYDYTPWLKFEPKVAKRGPVKFDPPCTYGGYLEGYFNNPEVRGKLHIDPVAPDW